MLCLMQSLPGSMADCPPDLLESIKELERLFTVDQAKLKEVTNHFVKELAKGKASKHTGEDRYRLNTDNIHTRTQC